MPMNLLIVEDSVLISGLLRELLNGLPGIGRIDHAATLAQALQSVRCDAPTLVILDLQLPDGNGMQIIGSLKQLSPSLRIAVLTLHADNAYRNQCLNRGADWFFDKATDIDVLLRQVRQQAALH
jgi:DNA-binding NarL/FixJ family response regulator